MSSESLSTNQVEVEPGRPDSWNVFAGAHRWWLRNRVPPTLGPAGTRSRAIRTSILLVVMGIVSSWVSFGALYLDAILLSQGWLIVPAGAEPFGCGPGFVYGIIVLVPLSRLLGRGWHATLLSLVVSAGLYYAAIQLHFAISPILGFTSKPMVGAWYAGLLGGVGVGLWMSRLVCLSMMWLPVACGLVASTSYSIVFPDRTPGNSAPAPALLRDAVTLLAFVRIFGTFQVPVAVVLGARLWGWPPKQPGAAHVAN